MCIYFYRNSFWWGVAVLITKVINQNHFFLIVFCGGVLAGLLGFELIPDVINSYQPIGIFIGISLGIFFVLIIDKFLHNTKSVQIVHTETFFYYSWHYSFIVYQ